MRRTRNPKFVQIDLVFFIYIYFFPGHAYWSDPWMDFDTQWLKTRGITQGLPFQDPQDGRPHLWSQIPQNCQN